MGLRRGGLRRGFVVFIASIGVAFFAATPSAIAAHPYISQEQYFTGLVNGDSSNATIVVDCAAGATVGSPANSQYLEVEQSGSGYTGVGATVDRVEAEFSKSKLIATFTQYGVKSSFAVAETVPCSGNGAIHFRPELPSNQAKSFVVKVKFKAVTGSPTT